MATRSTLPILSGVLLEADNDSLTLQTTDLELSVQYTVAALVEQPGRAVVPGKLFADIVKNLPDAAVHVEADEENAVITCDNGLVLHQGAQPRRFPRLPARRRDPARGHPVRPVRLYGAPGGARGVEGREPRHPHRRAHHIEDGRLKMVATDSYRLAITEAELPE